GRGGGDGCPSRRAGRRGARARAYRGDHDRARRGPAGSDPEHAHVRRRAAAPAGRGRTADGRGAPWRRTPLGGAPGGVAPVAGQRRDPARAGGREGGALVLVDDGCSHWGLARDLGIVRLDAAGAGRDERLVPAGRLREPWRALQRAEVVVVSRAPAGAARAT